MKTILIYSGGLDSTTLLYKLKAEGREVKALSINYGQKHIKELAAAEKICATLGVEFKVVDLSGIKSLLRGSSQTDDSVVVPDGHYAEDVMKKTIVSNRNMIMLAVAGAWAISERESNSSWSRPLAAGTGTVRSVIFVKTANVPSEPAISFAMSILPS